jgi:hypothetical protein
VSPPDREKRPRDFFLEIVSADGLAGSRRKKSVVMSQSGLILLLICHVSHFKTTSMSSHSTGGPRLPPPALQSSRVLIHESGGRGGIGADRTAAIGGTNETTSLRDEYQHNALPAGGTVTTHLQADPAQASASARRRKPIATTATPGSNGKHVNGHNYANGSTNHKKSSSAPVSPVDRWKPRRDVRTRLPRWMRRWTGYRDPDAKPPYDCLPIPPFTWLAKLPLKYETWILSTGASTASLMVASHYFNDLCYYYLTAPSFLCLQSDPSSASPSSKSSSPLLSPMTVPFSSSHLMVLQLFSLSAQ